MRDGGDYYRDGRFRTPVQGGQVRSRYDLGTADFTDLQQRDVAPIRVYRFQSNAGADQVFVINQPGRGFMGLIYGAAGVPGNNNQRMLIRINKDQPDCEMTVTDGRGYRGDFIKLFVTIPFNVPGDTLDLVVAQFDGLPYVAGPR